MLRFLVVSTLIAQLPLRVRSRWLRIDLRVAKCRGTWLTAEAIGALVGKLSEGPLLTDGGTVGRGSSLPVPVVSVRSRRCSTPSGCALSS